jgi:hypothetical protein
MAYCRFGPSDVYVFMDVGGYLNCCGCYRTDDGRSFHADSTQEMVDHLALHRASGDNVPDIEPDLWAEDEENFGGRS